MKTTLFFIVLLLSTAGFAFESEMCAEVYPTDKEECILLVENNKFEKIPVELCQFRISKDEMLDCYKAIKNKKYMYDVILDCAARHRYGIPGCLSQNGTLMDL
jgi:hypothetical protein